MKILKFFLHHKKTSFFILLLLFLFIYGSISASTLQESYEPETPVYRWETGSTANLRGQSYYAESSYSLDYISIAGGRDGTGGTAYLGLWPAQTIDGNCTSTQIATSSPVDYTAASNYPNFDYIDFTFTGNPSITQGEQYCFAIYRISGTFAEYGLDPGAYASGSQIYSNNTGGTWAVNDGDLWFQVYSTGDAPPATEDLNYSLVLAVIMAGVFFVVLFDMLRRHFIMK